MKYFKILIVFLLLATSCQEKKEEKETTQMEMVIAIHDEVMPKMSTISKLVSELKPIVDSTGTENEYAESMKELQDAHKAMMDWMRGFGDRFDYDEIQNGKELTTEKQEWLDKEEVKVKALRDQINSSIARAETLLER